MNILEHQHKAILIGKFFERHFALELEVLALSTALRAKVAEALSIPLAHKDIITGYPTTSPTSLTISFQTGWGWDQKYSNSSLYWKLMNGVERLCDPESPVEFSSSKPPKIFRRWTHSAGHLKGTLTIFAPIPMRQLEVLVVRGWLESETHTSLTLRCPTP
jgi:hypothetical protein